MRLERQVALHALSSNSGLFLVTDIFISLWIEVNNYIEIHGVFGIFNVGYTIGTNQIFVQWVN